MTIIYYNGDMSHEMMPSMRKGGKLLGGLLRNAGKMNVLPPSVARYACWFF